MEQISPLEKVWEKFENHFQKIILDIEAEEEKLGEKYGKRIFEKV